MAWTDDVDDAAAPLPSEATYRSDVAAVVDQLRLRVEGHGGTLISTPLKGGAWLRVSVTLRGVPRTISVLLDRAEPVAEVRDRLARWIRGSR